MSKLFQIYEDDLATLEHDIPAMLEDADEDVESGKQRTRIRRIQDILANVRWNYGPVTVVKKSPAGGEN